MAASFSSASLRRLLDCQRAVLAQRDASHPSVNLFFEHEGLGARRHTEPEPPESRHHG